MGYQRFNKGGRVDKSPFLAKSVQKSLFRLFSKTNLFLISDYSETVDFLT